MNLDRRLIMSVLTGNDGPKPLEKIKIIESVGHEFEQSNKVVYDFVKKFVSTHGKVPTKDAMQAKFSNFQLKGGDDPFDFYVEEAIQLRRSLELSKTLQDVEQLLAKGDVNSAMGTLISRAKDVDLRENSKKDLSFKDNFGTYLESYKAKHSLADASGYRVGIKSIDEITFGLSPGDYWLLIGRPGSMKSWILCMWALGMAESLEEGYKLVFFSKEMKSRQIYARLLAIAGQSSYATLRRYKMDPEQVEKLHKKVKKVKNDIIIVDSIPKASEVQMKLMQYDTKAFVLDGLYLFSPSVDWDEIADASRTIRGCALDLDIPSIVSSQFGKKGSKDMSADNIAYSDSLYQDGSVIIGQERVYDEVQERKTNVLRWKILKNREEDDGQIVYGTLDFERSRIVEGKGGSDAYWDVDDLTTSKKLKSKERTTQ